MECIQSEIECGSWIQPVICFPSLSPQLGNADLFSVSSPLCLLFSSLPCVGWPLSPCHTLCLHLGQAMSAKLDGVPVSMETPLLLCAGCDRLGRLNRMLVRQTPPASDTTRSACVHIQQRLSVILILTALRDLEEMRNQAIEPQVSFPKPVLTAPILMYHSFRCSTLISLLNSISPVLPRFTHLCSGTLHSAASNLPEISPEENSHSQGIYQANHH